MYNVGELVRLKNGTLARLLKIIGNNVFVASTKYGNITIGTAGNDLEILSHASIVEMKQCQSCTDFNDAAYFYKFGNEEMCKTCHDICVENQLNAESLQQTEEDLYNWR